MIVQLVTARVYLAPDGRRFFSRAAARRRSARCAYYAKHECDCQRETHEEPGNTCVGHKMDPQRFSQILDRLVRWWMRAEKRATGGKP